MPQQIQLIIENYNYNPQYHGRAAKISQALGFICQVATEQCAKSAANQSQRMRARAPMCNRFMMQFR